MDAEIERRFNYHLTSRAPEKSLLYGRLRQKAKDLAYAIKEECPVGREASLATTALEESLMWAIAAIARS